MHAICYTVPWLFWGDREERKELLIILKKRGRRNKKRRNKKRGSFGYFCQFVHLMPNLSVLSVMCDPIILTLHNRLLMIFQHLDAMQLDTTKLPIQLNLIRLSQLSNCLSIVKQFPTWQLCCGGRHERIFTTVSRATSNSSTLSSALHVGSIAIISIFVNIFWNF